MAETESMEDEEEQSFDLGRSEKTSIYTASKLSLYKSSKQSISSKFSL